MTARRRKEEHAKAGKTKAIDLRDEKSAVFLICTVSKTHKCLVLFKFAKDLGIGPEM